MSTVIVRQFEGDISSLRLLWLSASRVAYFIKKLSGVIFLETVGFNFKIALGKFIVLWQGEFENGIDCQLDLCFVFIKP